MYVYSVSGEYPPSGFFITVIDTSTRKIVDNFTLPFSISNIAFDKQNSILYASSGSKLYYIDLERRNYRIIRNESGPIYSIYLVNGTSYLAEGLSNKLLLIDRNGGEKIWEAVLPSYPTLIFSYRDTLVVFCPSVREAKMLSIADGSELRSIGMPEELYPLSGLMYGSKIYIAAGTNYLFEIHLPDMTIEKAKIEGLNNITLVGLDSKREFLFAVSDNKLAAVLLPKLKTLSILNMSYTISSIGVNQNNGEVYIANYHMITFLQPNRETNQPYLGYVAVTTLTVGLFLFLLIWKTKGYHTYLKRASHT
jgi:hypothetical protein